MINRVVFRNEMYMARRTIIAGNIGVAALMALFGGMSSMIIDSPMGDMIAQVIDFVPPALLHAFNFDVASLRTFEGWMASEPLTLFMIIVGMMAASSVGGVLVMASFALDVVAGLNDQVAWLGYASLFRLFDVNELVAGASLPLLQTASALGLFAAGVAIGVWGFRRKDIS